jgi:hypothetical protein
MTTMGMHKSAMMITLPWRDERDEENLQECDREALDAAGFRATTECVEAAVSAGAITDRSKDA